VHFHLYIIVILVSIVYTEPKEPKSFIHSISTGKVSNNSLLKICRKIRFAKAWPICSVAATATSPIDLCHSGAMMVVALAVYYFRLKRHTRWWVTFTAGRPVKEVHSTSLDIYCRPTRLLLPRNAPALCSAPERPPRRALENAFGSFRRRSPPYMTHYSPLMTSVEWRVTDEAVRCLYDAINA